MRPNLQALSFRLAILASGLAMFALACGGSSSSSGGKGGSPGDGSAGAGGAKTDGGSGGGSGGAKTDGGSGGGSGGAVADSGAGGAGGGTGGAQGNDSGAGGQAGVDAGVDSGTGGTALVPPWHAFLPLAAAAPGSTATNGTTLDLSPNHYDATYFGTTLSFANGSLNLTGSASEFVVVPPKNGVPAVDVTGSYSVAAWVTMTNVAGFRTFVSGEGQNIASFFLQKRGDSNAFAFTTAAVDSITNTGGCIAPGPATDGGTPQIPVTPVVSTQYHLAATRDATTGIQILYVNGVESGRNSCVAGFADTGILGIGHGIFNTGRVDNVQGAIAEVGVINRVLTPAEVAALYARGRIGMPPPDAGTTPPDAGTPDAGIDAPAATDAGTDTATGTD